MVNQELEKKIEHLFDLMPPTEKEVLENFLNLIYSKYNHLSNTEQIKNFSRPQEKVRDFLQSFSFYHEYEDEIKKDIASLNLRSNMELRKETFSKGETIVDGTQENTILIIPKAEPNSIAMHLLKDNKIFKLSVADINSFIIGEFEAFYPGDRGAYKVKVKSLREVDVYWTSKETFFEMLKIYRLSLWFNGVLIKKVKIINADLWKIKYLRYYLFEHIVNGFVAVVEKNENIKKREVEIDFSQNKISGFEVIKGDARRCVADLKKRNNLRISGTRAVRKVLISCDKLMSVLKYQDLKDILNSRVCTKYMCCECFKKVEQNKKTAPTKGTVKA